MTLSSSLTLCWTPLLAAAFCISCTSRAQVDGPGPPPQSAGASRLNEWRILGPGGGSAMFFPVVSPHDKKTFLVTSDMTGCYITEDGGVSWRMFYLRYTCRAVWDPKDPDVIYAATGYTGLYKSTDRGKTWQMILPSPRDAWKLVYVEDEGEAVLLAAPRRPAIPDVSAVAVDPDDSKIVYAIQSAFLVRSKNGGKSFSTLTRAFNGGRRIWIDPRTKGDKRLVFLHGRYRFGYWDGDKFFDRTPPFKMSQIRDSTVVFPADGGTPVIWLTAAGMIFGKPRPAVLLKSTDMGVTWHDARGKIAALGDHESELLIRAVAVAPSKTEVMYVSYSALMKGTPRKSTFGVAKSEDAGEAWRLVWAESDKPAGNIEDPWLSTTFTPEWGENPIHMAVHPSDPGLVVTTDFGRAMKTNDGGKTWRGLYAKKTGGSTWTSTGLDVLNCYGVHFDPHTPGRLLASCTDIGVQQSDDRGSTWSTASKGIPHLWKNTMYWVEFDPSEKGRAWGAVSRIHDIPRERIFHANRSNWMGGVVTTTNGGRSWEVSSEGLPDAPVTHVLLDPNSPPGRRTLWASVVQHGIYRSDDNGRTWVKKGNGIEEKVPLVWRMAMDSAGSLYCVITRSGMAAVGRLYRSRDRGENWIPIELPNDVTGPMDVAADPKYPKRLYLTAWLHRNPQAEERVSGGGLFISDDAGATWRPALNGPIHMYSINVDAARDRLYATGFTCAIWRSNDRGATWRRLPGFNFKQGHRVFPDPFDESKIYVTTMGGSIWYGPADGAPQGSSEDITGPELVSYDQPVPRGK